MNHFFSKLSMMIDTTQVYNQILAWVTLAFISFIQGHRVMTKLEHVQSIRCKETLSCQNFCDGYIKGMVIQVKYSLNGLWGFAQFKLLFRVFFLSVPFSCTEFYRNFMFASVNLLCVYANWCAIWFLLLLFLLFIFPFFFFSFLFEKGREDISNVCLHQFQLNLKVHKPEQRRNTINSYMHFKRLETVVGIRGSGVLCLSNVGFTNVLVVCSRLPSPKRRDVLIYLLMPIVPGGA